MTPERPTTTPAHPGVRILRVGERLTLPWRPRTVVVVVVLLVLMGILAVLTLAWGPMGTSPHDLAAALRGEADATTTFVLERLRGPRILTAIGAGIALGLAGALFQSVTRNPLGSPDVIGLGAGAGAGVAVSTLWWPGVFPAPVGAVIGAGVAVGIVWWSTGMGFGSPARVIITGIGVFAMATAVTHYVVAVALRDSAHDLAAYLVGSLGTRNMQHVAIIGVGLVVLIPLVVMLSRRLLVMDLGDDVAETLGAGARTTRTQAIILAVLLAAAAVSVAGPVAFVALTAPHIARKLSRAPGPNLTLAAVTGALILVSADLLAQQAPGLAGLPVGIVTAAAGGVYLGYLLVLEWRR
ncbi:FecCD family ABC transporter permease [Nesterenkonia alba]|uniref:FecCD family ABC transporter permease n=1 Tax=Nesterenkonia alba TaxID=515814 RepID=UPI001B7F9360|nr:iron chelate uptake ABC transporter family permease subunit [Nesterenkonia alba]